MELSCQNKHEKIINLSYNHQMNEKLDKENLTRLLKEAERAHAEYEKSLGRADENWPAWYADFILKNQPEEKQSAS